MKQFFWSKITIDRINSTVWKEISQPLLNEWNSSDTSSDESEQEDNGEESLKIDTNELDKLFRKRNSICTNKSHKQLIRKHNLITLLEFNRANNIAIMLAKIKLSYPEIRDSIWNIDDNKLTVDNLIAIRQYIPSKEEIEIVKEYQGDVNMLGNAERYFIAIMYIPRLADRLNCMIFRRRFNQELKEIIPELDTIQMAINELKESARFKRVLKTVLAIGNYLNEKTIRGNALGFRLDALLKMRDTKAEGEGVNNVPTLLHYLVYLLTKSGNDVVNFKQDISHLHAASRRKSVNKALKIFLMTSFFSIGASFIYIGKFL
ncbi:Formin, FH2 domain-containing protein [Sporodiniella umbellata]|nr:Formin, FH2 domain-containing protein [Sporodiniella umbellata]